MEELKEGQKFRLKNDREVEGIIVYGAPCSGHFEGTLQSGEVLILDQQPQDGTKGCWLVPERYDHFEKIFIPQDILEQEDYSSYAIGILYEELERDFEKIE